VAQLSVRVTGGGCSRARTVQALAESTPGRMQIDRNDPTAFSLGILGDLHMDPRDLGHSMEVRAVGRAERGASGARRELQRRGRSNNAKPTRRINSSEARSTTHSGSNTRSWVSLR
jgi:hypothetical protein